MASSCQVGDGLCVTFIVFLVLPVTFPLNDYYFYNLDNAYSKSLSHVSISHIHKREASTNEQVEVSTKPSSLTPDFIKLDRLDQTVKMQSYSTTPPTLPTRFTTIDPLKRNNGIAKDVMNDFNHTFDHNDDEEDDISISKFSDSNLNFNDTLRQHNITITRTDSHIYYNSSFKTDATMGQYFWVDMTNKSDVRVSDLLSKSHRRAATVKLSFDFPFYGHYIRNVTIATGGFLYTGDYVHSWLAATQYIAPLMANFDTSLSNDSFIKYYDNGTAFTVLWENVSLQDKPNDGKFTFQATLHSNGDIIFVYQNVPIIIENIQDSHHPVKVGLSDAYIIDRTIFFVRRKTIYEYHRVDFRKEDIKNWTVISLTAQPTCPVIKDCTSCLTKELANFKCLWCPSLNKCSNGLDRNRQEWLVKGCDKRQIKNESECSQIFTSDSFDNHDVTYGHENGFDTIGDDPTRASSRISHESNELVNIEPVHMAVSSIVAVLFIAALTVALGIWALYAYRNPHTTSGQILIRYRPSQWSWRRGEARYTAATIHM